MGVTKIPYADMGWNPICGCNYPLVSIGCENCFARSLHNQRHRAYLAGKKLPKMYAKPFEEIQFFPERLEEPLKWRKPQIVFVGSQTDLFHEEVENDDVIDIFQVIRKCPKHKFLMLTKRISGAKNYCDWLGFQDVYPNLYLGVTVCNQAEADKNIPLALQIPAAHLWISLEPLLENIIIPLELLKRISYLVVGCESGPNAKPCRLEWIESIVDQCKAAGVKCFVKQVQLPKMDGMKNNIGYESKEISVSMLDHAIKYEGFRISTKPDEWPEKLRRREFV